MINSCDSLGNQPQAIGCKVNILGQIDYVILSANYGLY